MRIAMVSTPFVAVPPRDYGGTELVVGELVEGLAANGHEVTLFATGDSNTACELRWLYPEAQWPPSPLTELNHVSWAMGEIADGSFEVVHTHCAAAMAFARLLPDAEVFGVEQSPEALAVARRNAEKNGVAVTLREGSLFEPLAGDRFDRWRHPLQLLLRRHRRCAGTGRLATDIDQRGAGAHHRLGMMQRSIQPAVATAIGKRVGSDVEDTHHLRTGKIEQPAATGQPAVKGTHSHREINALRPDRRSACPRAGQPLAAA